MIFSELTGSVSLFSILFIILSFYFTLTFFENLRHNDKRVATQSKLAAVVCFSLALLMILL